MDAMTQDHIELRTEFVGLVRQLTVPQLQRLNTECKRVGILDALKLMVDEPTTPMT